MLQCCNICKKLTDTLENTLNFDLFYCLNIDCTVYSYIYWNWFITYSTEYMTIRTTDKSAPLILENRLFLTFKINKDLIDFKVTHYQKP